ncbi:NUDIX hydrolase [Bifidobacterium criceti]|uniref:ADP-ribose pyrophosphatase n=1 Tax=Bifidobacterium criceti TaxID=1960969 RepID=A0A2A2EDL8_9BIFI|nr:NUDIX hydrolase [Bifidobacterium criceti]PAU67026.1 ADP-ribose pyrophosphatase [Bifidobacterium criceti]
MGVGNVSERRNEAPQVGVTSVILALGPADDGERRRLWMPLVRRIREPYLGAWALPGGPLKAGRSLERSAYETLASTTDLHPKYLEQLYTFGDPERSRGGVPMVSICYWALVGQVDVASLETKHNVAWFADDALPELAFDHRRIVDYATWRLRHRLDMPQVVRELVGDEFTLRELHAVSEAIEGHSIDLANFRRRTLASGMIEETGARRRVGRQRPAALYRFRSDADGIAGDAGSVADAALPQGFGVSELSRFANVDAHMDADDAHMSALSALTTDTRV